ncbi:MAG: LTA synthase family protein [Pseudomonadota bacterium]|nr:LTA synthase family protein [Pseudomonadota bacterium]
MSRFSSSGDLRSRLKPLLEGARRFGSPLLRVIDALVPRAEDLAPALLTGLIGLVPLAAARVWIASSVSPKATSVDLWRVLFGEIEAWCIVMFVGALAIRHAPRRAAFVARYGLPAFGTALLVLSITELTFFSVTGGRGDLEVLLFALEDLPQVAPVFMSEVKAWQLAAIAIAVLIGLSPSLVRARRVPPVYGRGALLLLVPVLLMEVDGRPRPRKDLRILQASLIEQLWWDGMERIGDETIPPTPEELEPVRLVRTEEKPPFNVVLILLESVAAQSTSVYQAEYDTTPHLAALAQKGWWARSMYSVVPHTSKAIITTMCGTWPRLVSEIRESRPGGLPDRCLPELLGELGYRSAFFQTADEGFENRGGLVHRMGFDLFRSRDTLRGPAFEDVNYFGIEDRAMIDPGLAWSKTGDEPFFATYLTLTSHHDYKTPSYWPKIAFGKAKGRQAQYFNAVRYVDDFVGRLIDAYEDAGLADNTLFVIQGDHGEAFGEHGRSMHDLVIYEEGLHIPLILYGPGVLAGTGVIEGPRQQIDVVPTLLDLLGVKTEGGYLPGTSLLSAVDEARSLFHSCWRSHRCLSRRTGDKKIIDHFRDAPMQHFDLASDPKERTDLRSELPPEALASARADMRSWRARVNGRYEAVEARHLAAAQTPDDAPAVASWAGRMDLLGCTILTPEVLPAEAVWLRCRWRANQELAQAWRVDLRLEGSDVETWGEPAVTDLPPLDGLLPTFQWLPGVAVEDDLRVFVPPGAPVGPATVSVGWERYGDGAIEMDGGGERHVVGTVQVLPPLHPYNAATASGAPVEVPSEDPDAEATP